MANTELLKRQIEPAIAVGFIRKHSARKLQCGRVLGMEFDVVAYSETDDVLLLGEITTSGFLGHNGRNFHIGAARKFCESYAKLHVATNHAAPISAHVRKKNPGVNPRSLHGFIIVPEGSRFDDALGWRRRLLEDHCIQLERIAVPPKLLHRMTEVLQDARTEQTG